MSSSFGFNKTKKIEIFNDSSSIKYRTQGSLLLCCIKLHLDTSIDVNNISYIPANWSYAINTKSNTEIFLYGSREYAISSSIWDTLIDLSQNVLSVSEMADANGEPLDNSSATIVNELKNQNIFYDFRNHGLHVQYKTYNKNLTCIKMNFENPIVLSSPNIPSNWNYVLNHNNNKEIILYGSVANKISSNSWANLLSLNISNTLLNISNVVDGSLNQILNSKSNVNGSNNILTNEEVFLIEFKQENGKIKFRTALNNNLTSVKLQFNEDLIASGYTFNIPNWKSVINTNNNNELFLYCSSAHVLPPIVWNELLSTTAILINVSDVTNINFKTILLRNIKIYTASPIIEVKQNEGLIQIISSSQQLCSIKLHYEEPFDESFNIVDNISTWNEPLINVENRKEIFLYGTTNNAIPLGILTTLLDTGTTNRLLKVSNMVNENIQNISDTHASISYV